MNALFRLRGFLVYTLLLFWASATVIFLATRLLPGDPARLVLGDLASAESVQALRGELGLADPLPLQYVHFLRSCVLWRFGASLRHPSSSAGAMAFAALLESAKVAGLAVLFGAAFGVLAATAKAQSTSQPFRRAVRFALDLLAALPLLGWVPAVLYVVVVRLGEGSLFEGGEASRFAAALMLAVPLGAHVGRVADEAIDAAVDAPFVRVARAKGRSRLRVTLAHVLPVVSSPIVAVIGLQFGALLGGVVVLERLLNRAGVGTLITDALFARDLPLLEASLLMSAALFAVVQAGARSLQSWIDPRGRPT